MPGRVNALREPLPTLLMRLAIKLDRRNQAELSPSLDAWALEDRSFFPDFLVAREVDCTGDFDLGFGFTAFESSAPTAANATG